jgi:chromosomal replication initiation ATPase DnaA
MQQFILPFNPQETYCPEDFIVSESNKHAFNIITSWPDNWGRPPYPKSLILYAPVSSGKTYLAKIWQKKSAGLFCSLTTDISEIDNNQAFIIESPEKWDEQKLFHFFNLINEKNKYLLMTTSSSPLRFTLKDLDSRIKSILTIGIDPIDNMLMQSLLFKYFSKNSIEVKPQVIQFLLAHLPRNFDSIRSAVIKINQYALEKKRPISIQVIKQIDLEIGL